MRCAPGNFYPRNTVLEIEKNKVGTLAKTMTNLGQHTHPDDLSELLSAYVDDAVDVVERRRVEAALESCAACAADLADLRSLHTMLRQLPPPLPRRSFTIDPATVRPQRRLFPIFRFASLAAALLLLFVVGFD